MKFTNYLYTKLKALDKDYNDYLNRLDMTNNVYSEEYLKNKLNELRSQRWLLEEIIEEYVSRETLKKED